jgi:hypothetical protein
MKQLPIPRGKDSFGMVFRLKMTIGEGLFPSAVIAKTSVMLHFPDPLVTILTSFFPF